MKVAGIFQHFDYKEYEYKYLEKYEDIEVGDLVIIQDADFKEEVGTVSYFHDNPKDPSLVFVDRSILRKATQHDRQKIEAHNERNNAAFELCKKIIAEHVIEMYLIKALYSLDGSKINFIFTAADRVDFRELVKDLAKTFQKQIHLQQIGPRDKAKIVGGYGRCGQQTCCSRFLPKLESITMDMVRAQNLTNKGSDKLSGLCGKLLCCLRYEVKQYVERKKHLPEIGDKVLLNNEMMVTIIGVDILNQKIKVLFEDNTTLICLPQDIKKPLHSNKHLIEAK